MLLDQRVDVRLCKVLGAHHLDLSDEAVEVNGAGRRRRGRPSVDLVTPPVGHRDLVGGHVPLDVPLRITLCVEQSNLEPLLAERQPDLSEGVLSSSINRVI